jgi:hypothetical protein
MADDPKTITTEIITIQRHDGKEAWRITDTLQGDVGGSTTVPSVEEARAELKGDWTALDDVLASVGDGLTRKQQIAIETAAANIEGSARRLAMAYLLEAAAGLHDDDVGAFFVVPRARYAPQPDSDEDLWAQATGAVETLRRISARINATTPEEGA